MFITGIVVYKYLASDFKAAQIHNHRYEVHLIRFSICYFYY